MANTISCPCGTFPSKTMWQRMEEEMSEAMVRAVDEYHESFQNVHQFGLTEKQKQTPFQAIQGILELSEGEEQVIHDLLFQFVQHYDAREFVWPCFCLAKAGCFETHELVTNLMFRSVLTLWPFQRDKDRNVFLPESFYQ